MFRIYDALFFTNDDLGGGGGGGADVAVLDPPAADPPATPPADPPADPPGGDPNDGGDEPKNPHRDEAVRLEAERMADDIIRERADAARKQADDNRVTASFDSTTKEISDLLNALAFEGFDEKGEKVTHKPTADHVKGVTDKVNALRTAVRTVEAEAIFDNLGNIAMAKLPSDEVRQKFVDDVTAGEGKDVPEWLASFAEHIAPTTAWGKGQAAALEKAKADGYDEGFTDGAKAPGGHPSQRGSHGTNGGKFANMTDLTAARSRGEVDDATLLSEQNRLLGITSEF